MADIADEPIVQALKASLTRAWQQVHKVPGERVYAFGVYTTPCADYAQPFACGEVGLQRVAAKYVDKGIYSAAEASGNLRWSVADSPYKFDENANPFADRPDVYDLPDAASEREIRFRLNAACRALKELDAEGLFGTGDARPLIWLEGGDVDNEWLEKWAKKLNPAAAFARFKARGDRTAEPIGTFTEFGTKKVYQTSRYAASADGTRLVAACNYHLFLFDTTGPMKQLASRQFPNRSDAEMVWDVATSGDAGLTAVRPFGGGPNRRTVWLVSGPTWKEVVTIPTAPPPTAVAVDPAGRWVAVGCGDGSATVYDTAGKLLVQLAEKHGREHQHSDMAVSRDGARLAWANGDGTVRVWNAADWSPGPAIADAADVIDFDPAGGRLVATQRCGVEFEPAAESPDRFARVFEVTTGQLVRRVEVPGYLIQRAVFSPDGRHLACALTGYMDEYNLGQEVALVDAETGRVVDRLKADFEAVYDFAFLPHRGEVAVAVFGHTRRPLVLWRPAGA